MHTLPWKTPWNEFQKPRHLRNETGWKYKILRSVERAFEVTSYEINPFTNLLADRLDEQRRLVIHRKFQTESEGENREKSEILLDKFIIFTAITWIHDSRGA